MPDVAAQTEIDVEQLVQDFGDFYLNNGQNLSNLHMLPFESFDTRDAFTIVPTEDTIIREANVEVEDILQQYQDEFTPKGGFGIKPVQIPLFQMKIDQEFNPTKLMSTWVGFLTSNKLDRADWPIVRWVIEQYIMFKSMEEMEKKGIYNAKWEQPQDGVAGDGTKVMNGVRKLVTDYIADGDLEAIITGAPQADPADFVTQIENFVKAWPEKYRSSIVMPINMSITLQQRFVEGMQKKYNMNYAQVADLKKVRNYDNVSVVGRPSMEGQNGWWATPKYNALMGIKGFSNASAFKVESAKRKVAIFSDWWAGIGFIQPKLLFVNDKVSF